MLAELTPSSNRNIVDYIKSNPDLNVFVSDEGDLVYVPQPAIHRHLLTLEAAVVKYHGACSKQEVTPSTFQTIGRKGFDKSDSSSKDSSANALKIKRIFQMAVEQAASDVFISIKKNITKLHFKTYGIKRFIQEYSVEDGQSIVRGIFTKSDHSQWDPSQPCDCAFDIEFGESSFRVRANSIKTTQGNTIVCRLRDPSHVVPLSQLGYSDLHIEHIERMSKSPGGLLLVSGETNSGKSTTVAALMDIIPDTKYLIEIADPVELEFDNCSHIEIDNYHEDSDSIFKNILASTVRQNPDVLVLGEIRDEKTVDACMSMAISGKRVLSTLHTQSCIGALPRLKNLGVDEYLLSLPDFVAGIINQNLVPVVCSHCYTTEHSDPKKDRHYKEKFTGANKIKFINPSGCQHCRNGISGQTLVAEVFPLCIDYGGAHKLIANREFHKLRDYMKDIHNVQSKHHHARLKIEEGLIDPEATETIIGEIVS